jgi:hypothetical protein
MMAAATFTHNAITCLSALSRVSDSSGTSAGNRKHNDTQSTAEISSVDEARGARAVKKNWR